MHTHAAPLRSHPHSTPLARPFFAPRCPPHTPLLAPSRLPLHLQVRPNGTALRPNGEVYTLAQRPALLRKLNGLITEGKPVHEVVCVLEPGTKRLRGMTLQVCNGRDELDPDWAAGIDVSAWC